MSDFVPKSDAAFYAWMVNFLSFLEGHDFGPEVPIGAAEDGVTDFAAARVARESALAGARAATANQRAARRAAEQTYREIARTLQAMSAVTDADRAAMGITVRDGVPSPVPLRDAAPVVKVEFAGPAEHRIVFGDGMLSPRIRKAKGATACEIWAATTAINAAPPTDFALLEVAMKSPMIARWTSDEIGKMAHYRVRWAGSRGRKGPWSGVVSAMITG